MSMAGEVVCRARPRSANRDVLHLAFHELFDRNWLWGVFEDYTWRREGKTDLVDLLGSEYVL